MERRGIPTATICTDHFASLAQLQARGLELPELPLVIIPHPLAARRPEEIEAMAAGVTDDVVRVLTQPRARLIAEYRSRTYLQPKEIGLRLSK